MINVTRIRYSQHKASPEVLISNINILLPSGNLIKVLLNTTTNTYQFVDTNNSHTISKGTANNLMNLKKLVRSTLLELGVPLEVEVKKSKKAAKAG